VPFGYSASPPSPPTRRRKKEDRSFGGFLANLAGDVPQLARSLAIDLPVATGRGLGHTAADIYRREYGSAGRRFGRLGLSITDEIDRLTPGVGPLRWLERKQVFGKNKKGDWDVWFDLDDPDDIEDAKDAWYDDPGIAALNVLPVAGTVGRAGSLAKISRSVRKANPGMTKGEAWRLAGTESRAPGFLDTLGIKGGIDPRKLRIEIPGGGKREVTLPRSSSPLGRGLESVYDSASRTLPLTTAGGRTVGGKFSEGARAGRFEKRLAKEDLRQIEAEIAGMSKPITDIAYRFSRGKTGPVWGFLKGEKEHTPTATALTALLQLPKQMDPKEALTAYLKSREQMLDEGVYVQRVHMALDDVDNPTQFVGKPAAYETPDAAPVWKIEHVDEDGAILTSGSDSVLANLDEVFPLERSRGGRYVPASKERTHLDDDSRALIRQEADEIKRFIENPPSPEKYEAAMRSMERISEMVEEIGAFINSRGMTEAQKLKLADRYRRRRELIVNDLAARDLIPEDMSARGYFPHFSLWRNLAANWTGPVRLPSSGLVVGKTQLQREVSRSSKNDLVLHQLGQVNMDPSVLLYLLSMRLRYAETFAMRKDFYDIAADEIPRGQGGYLIRNPDAAAKSISDRTKAELHMTDEEWEKLVNRGEDTATVLDDPEAVASAADDWVAHRESRPLPEWQGEPDVRWLPDHVVEARFGRRVNRKEAPSMLGLANTLARFSLIIGRPIRYALSNVPSNILMLAATNPEALPTAMKLMARGRPKGVDDELLTLIRSQSGEVRATAGIPKFTTSRVGTFEKLEEGAARESTRLADVLGSAVDEPFRIAAWMSRARKMGFDTPEDWKRLLNAKKEDVADFPEEAALIRAREQIRQRTRDDLLDFDSLTQWEREQATRFLFVWPYLRAAMKWPAVYARERPVITGIAANLAEQAPEQPLDVPFTTGQGSSEVEVPGVDLPGPFDIPKGRYDLAQVNPLSVVAETAGTTQSVARGDLSAAFDYLTPAVGFAAGLKDTRNVSDALWQGLANFVPYGQMIRTTGDSGFRRALADEALRFTPRKPFRSTRKAKAQEEEDIERAYGDVIDEPMFRRSFDAYWDYRDRASRLRLATRERYGREKLTVEEEYELLTRVWDKHFPDISRPKMAPSETYNDAIAGAMFRAREYLAHGLPDEEPE